jgi:hypothetical protein
VPGLDMRELVGGIRPRQQHPDVHTWEWRLVGLPQEFADSLPEDSRQLLVALKTLHSQE